MANITTATNGTYQPVSNVDAGTTATSPGAGWPTPLNSATSAVTVNLAGPKLDFFTITLASLATDGAVLNAAMLAIQTKATIAMYEVTDAGTDTLAIAVYPTGAWTTGTLDTATGGSSAASATFTN
jgi:hypothetical protein|tara:strand:+ start:1153 stop:1530 length:378 start_codon:yes stop_codon:yes gene_type:complete